MKVAILLYSLGSGGAERQASLLANRLANDGYEVELFLVYDKIFYDLDSAIKLHILDNAPLFLSPYKKFAKLLPLAKKYAKLCNADISISFMNRPNYINILSRFFGNRAKIIVSERGTPSTYYQGLQGFVSRWLIRFLYPRADMVIANADANRKDLEKNFYIKKIQTIYNMFDLAQIEKLCQNAKRYEKFTFITVGRIDEYKNQILQIEALAHSGLDAQLVIIGDGPLRSKLTARAKELGIGEKVHFLGVQKNVFSYLKNADCFLLTSRSEGFPNVLVEAMACGLPVIATDCKSGPAEILEEGKLGILIPNNDKDALIKSMQKIYQDKNLRKQLSKRAKMRAKDFAIDKIFDSWKEVIDEYTKG
ncbi:glycosyltransferase family 4 protein [Nitratiruptor sp. YY09-18]|uniref:glycosyltransferase family 4 protein n=1 Tax=Nitratiruptor sp. YY09-18 TaxID=2724901 RepID=UPI0019156C23|nr:glycosyltransferase family 4 protein [Nitratiruptor sp. YY09-18]BCD67751.1 N-acetylgalactosamine-N,N'-diacetylbacillosaminyl-diphospho-undecaprenol 4-alpha-N-acetylgalactosaminyltransferase [Nitratiruptor sp. YY09-18]